MRCPFCGAQDTKVIDSRLANEGDQIRRRRQCLSCEERFTTYESAELTMPRIIKSNGTRENFSEDKLRAGLMRALEKRPVSMESIESAVARIKHRLLVAGEREVSSRKVGESVMDELRRLDQVAYIRFASVYLSFEDVSAFREMIERIEREPSPEAMRAQIPLLGEDDPRNPGE